MNKQINLGLILAALLLTAACSTESNQTQPVTSRTDAGTSTAPPANEVAQRGNALVRVINAVPGATSFDVFADDQKVFEEVSFKSITPYKELSDDRHTFHVRQTGQDSAPVTADDIADGAPFRWNQPGHDSAQPVAENSESLSGGRHYTIVIMPDTNDKTIVSVINDNIAPPPADKARVRVIHALPDTGGVDIVDRQGNKKLFSGINFERETSYLDVDPSKTTLEVRPEGQDKAVLTVPNANFEKGKLYTIVVTGHAKATPKLQALMVEDQLGGTGATASMEPKVPTTERW
jgi:hypothetical protein